MPRERRIAVCTVASTFSSFRAPRYWAMTTLAPREIPMRSVTRRPMTGILFPTAAMASFPTNRPRIKTSALLKSCSNMPISPTGIAKKNNLSAIEP
jgi:hypothetical protein